MGWLGTLIYIAAMEICDAGGQGTLIYVVTTVTQIMRMYVSYVLVFGP